MTQLLKNTVCCQALVKQPSRLLFRHSLKWNLWLVVVLHTTNVIRIKYCYSTKTTVVYRSQ